MRDRTVAAGLLDAVAENFDCAFDTITDLAGHMPKNCGYSTPTPMGALPTSCRTIPATRCPSTSRGEKTDPTSAAG